MTSSMIRYTTMMMRQSMAAAVVVAGMGAGVATAQQPAAPASGQQQPGAVHDPAAVTVGGPESGAAHSWTTEQLLTSTVHEAWVLSGRNEDQFFDMVKELAAMSAQKRGLTLPESADAGAKAGQMIKKVAKKDPDQLLYAVVDHAVMKTAAKSGGAATTK